MASNSNSTGRAELNHKELTHHKHQLNDLIFHEISNGNLNKIRGIVKKHPYCVQWRETNNNMTPLLYAAVLGCINIFNYLLKQRFTDDHAIDKHGRDIVDLARISTNARLINLAFDKYYNSSHSSENKRHQSNIFPIQKHK